VLAFLKQNEEALANYAQALTLFQQVGSSLGQANALLATGDIKRRQNDYAGAWSAYEQAAARYTVIGDKYSIARVLYRMGDWQAEQENPAAAVALYRQAIALWEVIGVHELAEQIIRPKLARVAAA
jgi:tetratricopeptide (TPR) repeat protein